MPASRSFNTPVRSPNPLNRCDHGITHICLDVADIDAEYEWLKSAGMTLHCPPQGMGGLRATYGRDPDGNVVELFEVTDAASPMALKVR